MAKVDGTNLDDVLHTTPDADLVNALAGNDVILIATAAAHPVGEVITGGAGFDRIWFTSTIGGDTLVLRATVTGIEAVELSDAGGDASGTVALNIDASVIASGVELVGNAGNNAITAGGGADVISGGEGADTILAGAGSDRVVMLISAGDIDTVDAGIAAEGNALVLVGTAGGVVTIDLSVGADADQLTVTGDAAVQSDFASVIAVEMLGAAINAKGSALANTLVGTALDDTLDGGAGADTLVGGEGSDLFLIGAVADHAATEVISGGGGADTLRFTATAPGSMLKFSTNFTAVENAEIADATGDTTGTASVGLNASGAKQAMLLKGNDGANAITGTKFADTLQGNGGADSLTGGEGNDLYVVTSGLHGVPGESIVDAKGTNDSVLFQATETGDLAKDTLTLGKTLSGIEAVHLSSTDVVPAATDALNLDASAVTSGGLALFGNAGANKLSGTAKNDTIEGHGGLDTLLGGKGADTIGFDVTEAVFDAADAGDASEGNMLRLKGTKAVEIVVNLASLADTDQILTVDGVADVAVQSDFTHFDAQTAGDAKFNVTGSTLANRIVGGGSDDTLEGGAGIDTVEGGDGNDIFLLGDSAHLPATEKLAGGAGTDILRFTSTKAGQTLLPSKNVSSIETFEIADAGGDTSGTTTLSINASGQSNGVKLIGNDGKNLLTGTKANDTINGNGGADVLVGGEGDDTYLYDDAKDILGDAITDTKGVDTLLFIGPDGDTLTIPAAVKGVENFVLGKPNDTDPAPGIHLDASLLTYDANFTGNEADNLLKGGKGNDSIDGGDGKDTIFGGAGNDSIVLTFEAGNVDAIDAGDGKEGNTLILKGSVPDVISIDLTVASGADQLTDDPEIQSDFTHIDASDLKSAGNFGVSIQGNARDNKLVGTDKRDVFAPGLGKDTIEGGGDDDVWYIFSQAEYDGDFYSDNGATLADYMYFVGTKGQTFVMRDNVAGVDVAAAGINPGDTTDLNIDASKVDHSFSMAGNAGKNVLTGTRHGETFFDWGGVDTMSGRGGSDEYYIADDTFWLPGDKIIETGPDRDQFSFADLDSGASLVVGKAVFGVEIFVIGGPDLAKTGDYIRDNTTTHAADLDVSGVITAIELAGNNGVNKLTATKANDTILGFGGMDTIVAGLGADVVTMEVDAGSIDQIDAGAMKEGNVLKLKGDADAEIVIDLSVVDGQDQLISVDGIPDVLIQNGFQHVIGEGLTGTKTALNVKGSAGANTLTGSLHDDTFNGNGGADSLSGGEGNDAFVITNLTHVGGGAKFDGGGGTDTLRFASTTTGQTLVVNTAAFNSVEVVTISDELGNTDGTTAINVSVAGSKIGWIMVGNDGVNLLTGGAKDDTITGNGGADVLNGGAGNDIYLVGEGGDVVAGEKISDVSGTKDVLRFISKTDGDLLVLTAGMTGLEIVEASNDLGDLTGKFKLDIDASAVKTKLLIRGNADDNVLTGTAGNDTIEAREGHDSIFGGAGADRVLSSLLDIDNLIDLGDLAEGNELVLEASPGNAVWDLNSTTDQLVSLAGGADGATVTGVTHINAKDTGSGMTVTVSNVANNLVGTSGDDVFIVTSLAHFAGDKYDGHTGKDSVRFTSTTAGDTLKLSPQVKNIEYASLSDEAGDTSGTASTHLNAAGVANGMELAGNDGANAITGTAFADTVSGNGGNDTIAAGAGADDITIDLTAGAIDTADAGALTEGNVLRLVGAPGGTVAVDLSAADQIVSLSAVNEAFKQSGFAHVNAGAITDALTINGTALDNRLTGGDGADTLTGAAGNDTIEGGTGADSVSGGTGLDRITMLLSTGDLDSIDAGSVAEQNVLVLKGSGAGTTVIDLSVLAGDQILTIGGGGEVLVQSGFVSIDASSASTALSITGSDSANTIAGSSTSDTISAGAGADRIEMSITGAIDVLDAGEGGEGDTLVLSGAASGAFDIDLSAAVGADQLVSLNGAAEVLLQTDFQHVDLTALTGGSGSIRGNDLDNVIAGSAEAETIVGLGGADTIKLGGQLEDKVSDTVVYESPEDGWNSTGAVFSFDRITTFDGGMDKVRFGGQFNGGSNDLDDVVGGDGIVSFATDGAADFDAKVEGLLISQSTSLLIGDDPLKDLDVIATTINALGVTAKAGEDGLISVESTTATGVYYYEESDGLADDVSASELVFLGSLTAGATTNQAVELALPEFGNDLGRFDDILIGADTFVFATDKLADFHQAHEALLITDSVSKLKGEQPLTNFTQIAAIANKIGVKASAGDDGLLVVQTSTSTGFYYYQEIDGKANSVGVADLTLLGVVDAKAAATDFGFL